MLIDYNGLLLVVTRVAAESTGGRELAEFVSDHVLRNVNGDELVAVVNCDSVTYKVRGDHTP